MVLCELVVILNWRLKQMVQYYFDARAKLCFWKTNGILSGWREARERVQLSV